ncbi:MAG: TolC family protein [Acidiphilium sp.]|nr:TolC family protein [Acidiphilium sp.]
MRLASRLLTTIGGAALLAGCAVGPNFHRPPAPAVSGYTEAPLPARTVEAAGGAQHLVVGARIEGEWWNLFHSPQLDRLIATALTNNPSLLAAQNALLAARDTTRAEQGSFFPSLSGSFQSTRERSPFGLTGSTAASTGSSPFTLLNTSVSVSYAPDIFGGVRRQVEDLRAQAEDQRFALEATYLSLTANIVTAAVTDASLVEQIKATDQIIAAEEKVLRVLHAQVALGGIPAANELT